MGIALEVSGLQIVVQVLIQCCKSKIDGREHTRAPSSIPVVKVVEIRYVSSVCTAHKTDKTSEGFEIFHLSANKAASYQQPGK